MSTFADLGVSKKLAKGIAELNITKPTPIQEQVIPLLLERKRDIVAQAQTGTGKTAAFGLPLLMQVNAGQPQLQGLILTPTRELGQQIAKQFFKFTKYTDRIFTEVVYGGEKIDVQIKKLKRTTHILVATPGRLIELMDKNCVDISKVQTVVLDEADEMLSMGFQKELDAILKILSPNRSTWLFSATFPKSVEQMVDTHVRKNAERIKIKGTSRTNSNIDHQFVVQEDVMKFDTLLQFLKTKKHQQGILFCRTKVAARELYQKIQSYGLPVSLLEGDMLQKDREKTLRAFRKKKTDYLIATDVVARGIDIADLAFVVHYQLPDHIEYFTHRSGRTARGYNTGISLCLISKGEIKILKAYERELGITFKQIR